MQIIRRGRICKRFKMKNLSEFDGFYVQSNTLLSADILENFRNTCLEICGYTQEIKRIIKLWIRFEKSG